MFREIRRKDRLVSADTGIEVLGRAINGVLSVIGDDGYPYGVPVNFAYKDNCIYIHCFLDGHKIDSIKKNPKVCFTVTADEEVMKEQISTNYTSVIIFGKAELFPPPANDVRKAAFAAILDKYIPGEEERTTKYAQSVEDKTNVIRINIEQMTCKQRSIR